ncbi:MAG: hypothetical protein QF805_29570, partial [Pirellulaceae bacterium]|nr:hypothetical protein [Pirellulaceae bacterium]
MPTTLVPVRCGVFMSLALLSLTTFAADGAKDGALSLTLRTRTRSAAESERFLMNFEQTEWQ